MGCARALIDYGLPISELSDDYSDEMAAVLADERARVEGRV